MVDGAPQKALCKGWMVWNPIPTGGNCTAPARHPDAWLPMMCSGPGAGVSAAATKLSADSTAIPARQSPKRLELSLEYLDDIARPDEGLGSGSALGRLAFA